MTQTIEIETPPGKGAADENFPVGSFLIAKELRPHVAAYYDFARAIDDIADDPDTPAKQKIKALKQMDAALVSGEGDGNLALDKAFKLRQTMLERDIDFANGQNLIVAFIQDCKKNRYRTWAELIGYCNNSASPVGRFLLELHGEDRANFRQSDALCNALQVINHLQDCKKDFLELDRSYLPGIWLTAAGETPQGVTKQKSSTGLRAVIDKCLSATRVLLAEAEQLPPLLLSRRLAMETAVIIDIAYKLVDELEKRDPVAERVELSKSQYLTSLVHGAWSGFWRK
jgi:squalene synthase HpnC